MSTPRPKYGNRGCNSIRPRRFVSGHFSGDQVRPEREQFLVPCVDDAGKCADFFAWEEGSTEKEEETDVLRPFPGIRVNLALDSSGLSRGR
jgi:hypothetical protein